MPRQPLCVTLGEPAGIGPDILLAAFSHETILPPFVVLGDPAFLERRALELGIKAKTAAWAPGVTPDPAAINMLCLSRPMTGKPGTPAPENAPLVIEAIERAVELVFDGAASGIVTCPIAKEALYAAGFVYPGHTEFLAELAFRRTGIRAVPVMMIASDILRTVPLTIHVALDKVASMISRELIIETGRITWRELRSRFAIERPRLAVAGLNPHAGEAGAMGREEIEIIAPAIRALQAEGIDVRGPLPADTMFHASARARYDAAICMYHDQALIPAKTLAFDDGVNVTLGLPFIRTSPDHGTAFDIAGTGKANPSSFIAALRMADAFAGRAAS
jgi:4-hydroxythreonine-4-phosphate dehydrogenase